MSERTWEDIGNEIRDDYIRADGPENINFRDVQWDVWRAEVERAAAVRALEDMAIRLYLTYDGGRRGVNEHSKSAASAKAHRRAMQMVRARAAEIREGKNE